jgi:hypothetical protein
LPSPKRTPTPSWRPAVAIVNALVPVSQLARVKFIELYDISRKRLLPLSDPLDAQFFLHRQLDSSREEVYSDWLHWIFEHIKEAELIGSVLKSEVITQAAGTLQIDREVGVPHGHHGKTGRLDLVFRQGTDWLSVIEIKTRAYVEEDLKKHRGYRKSVESGQTDFIFLAIDPPGIDLESFRFVSWATVCIELRRIAPNLLGPGEILGTAMMLAFVGAVERNLLGFVFPAANSSKDSKFPIMLDHLNDALVKEEKHAY